MSSTGQSSNSHNQQKRQVRDFEEDSGDNAAVEKESTIATPAKKKLTNKKNKWKYQTKTGVRHQHKSRE